MTLPLCVQESTVAGSAEGSTGKLIIAAPAPEIPPGSVAQGLVSYYYEERIGKGGFGEVFKGTYSVGTTLWCIPIALKRTLPLTDPTADLEELIHKQEHRLGSLSREAGVYYSATLCTGSSRHIVLLREIAIVRNNHGGEEPLLVLQWANGPGGCLTDWMKQNPDTGQTIRCRLSFAVQMFAGLRALHTATAETPGTEASVLVHHDVKPDNMLLFAADDKTGPIRLALTDFGLTVKCNAAKDRVSGGTRRYMSPEQWRSEPVLTPGRDVWAAGLVLAELVGGDNTTLALRRYAEYIGRVYVYRLPPTGCE